MTDRPPFSGCTNCAPCCVCGDDSYDNHQELAALRRVVDDQRAEIATRKADHQRACETIAQMHAAAVGNVRGPFRGVVEDVADLRAAFLKALKALPTTDEADKLSSMRDELVASDWSYWHHDPAILYLNKLLGSEPPMPEWIKSTGTTSTPPIARSQGTVTLTSTQARVVTAVNELRSDTITELRAALREACDLYDAAECVGPLRHEPERIAALRKLAE